ncbi:anthranilate synthase component II [Faucicola mancuniensis]|uniref:anthranilate synthase component II n=1 Tax=Faucicola mancuniensis TaxID=1309795 RepID=UPI00397773D5
MNVLIIDNYDSFTFNLYQYIGEILTDIKNKNGNDFTITVKRNNELTLDDVKALNPDRIIISPGPGSPDDPAYFGVCGEVITEIGKTVPLLGVCLGMQGIAHFFGGKVVRANTPMHGKTSPIRHDGKGVYHGLPQNIDIMRYHSLMVEAMSLPDCLEITSLVQNDKNLDKSMKDASLLGDEIMGIRHKEYPIQGVQYHPESFATEGARNLLKNFLVQV